MWLLNAVIARLLAHSLLVEGGRAIRGADSLTVLDYFTTGVNLTVGTIFTATGSWLAYDIVPLAIPAIILIFLACITPLYYLVVRDDYYESNRPT